MVANQLAVVGPDDDRDDWSEARKQFILKTYCGGADEKTALTFLELCQRRRLSPEARHVYLVNRAKKNDAPNWVIQTGIDGYRLIADRTGRYAGSDDPVFVHDPEGRVAVASVTVRKLISGSVVGAFTASARWDEYAAGSPMWNKMPHTMLAKCAEALALRKAFPEELSGMYTDAEMDQAEDPAPKRVVNRATGEITERAAKSSQKPVHEATAALGEPVMDWTVMWNQLKARKIDGPTYEAIVGKPAGKFQTPQAALDALKAAEDLIEADQGDVVEGEYIDYDPKAEQEVLGRDEPGWQGGDADRFTR